MWYNGILSVLSEMRYQAIKKHGEPSIHITK